MSKLVLFTALAFALTVGPANAAVVSFFGRVDTLTGPAGFLGTVPPVVPFTMTLNIADGPGPSGAITSGVLSFAGFPTLNSTIGSSVNLTEGGTSDTLSFLVLTSGGVGIFNFTGDFITGTAVNQAAFSRIPFSTASFDFASGGTLYEGTITAVPEPGTCLALVGLVGVCGWRVRRKSKNTP